MLQAALTSLKKQFTWSASLILLLSQLIIPFVSVSTAYAANNDITASDHEGQLSGGSWSNGNITQYAEKESINFRFTVTNGGAGAASGNLDVEFTGIETTGQACTFFEQDFVLGATTPLSGATPTVLANGAVTQDGDEWVQNLAVSFAAPGSAVINYTLTLTDEAGDCGGSSQHSQLGGTTGDFKNVGNQNVPVPANDILELADIVAVKEFDDDRDGQADRTANADEWEFDLDGAQLQSTDGDGEVLWTGVDAGTHVISEDTTDTGYTMIGGSGACSFDTNAETGSVNVTLTTSPQTITCTFLNQKDLPPVGTLTLVKTVVNNDGGNLTEDDFPVQIDGNDSIWGSHEVAPGSYVVSETTQPGYAAGDWGGDCDSNGNVTVPAGGEATCTITNDDIAPTLTIKKTVQNNNGGDATQDNFQGYIDAVATNWDTPVEQEAGVEITVSEDDYPGYTAGDWGGDCAADGTITLELAQDAVCTITNDDDAPQLFVEKFVYNDNGGTLDANNVNLYVNGGSPLDNIVNQGDSPTVNFVRHQYEGAEANTEYTISEDNVDGYNPSDVICRDVFTNELVAHPVTLSPGESVKCSISNDDIAPKLTVIKIVDDNWNGGLDVSDFPLYVDGQLVVSGETNTYNAGTVIVSEDQQDGYQLVDVAGDCNFGGEVTLEVGGTYTCTLYNQDQPAIIVVNKEVINKDGGTATAANFELYVGNTLVTNGAENTFAGNTSYSITEKMLVPGYEQTSVSCENVTDDVLVPLDQNDAFEAENGNKYVCLIVNDDVAPKLQLKKTVINDDGGNNPATDWTLSAKSGDVSWINEQGTAVSDDMAVTSSVAVQAGVPIDLSETGPSGYTPSDWQCDGGNWDNDQLYLSAGDDVVCEITNNDQPVSITVVKVARNDDGGQVPAKDFNLYINGRSLDSNLVDAGDVNPVETFAEYFVRGVDSNTEYTVSEDMIPGYDLESIKCRLVGQDLRAPIELSNPFTPAEGQNVECVVFNNDEPAKLTLVKEVINDDGGKAKVDWWKLRADGPTTVEGYDETESLETGVTEYVSAGTYYLSELGTDRYELTNITCNGREVNLENPRIVIRNGMDVTCVFTNDDIPPTLRLTKQVVTVQEETTQEFEVYARQGDSMFESPYVIDVNDYSVTPDTVVIDGEDGLDAGRVRIGENVPEGWQLMDIQCYPTNQGPIFNVQSEDDTEFSADERRDRDSRRLYLKPGDDITCTFVNVEKARVNVTKFWDVNQNGEFDEGESTLPDWTFDLERCRNEFLMNEVVSIDGPQVRPPQDSSCDIFRDTDLVTAEHYRSRTQSETTGLDGVATFENLKPFGHYVLSEQFEDGWNLSGITCEYPDLYSEGIRGFDPNEYHIFTFPGAQIECYVGNYQDAQLLIEKTNDRIGDNLVDGDTVVYTITVTNPADSGVSYDTVTYDLMPENIIYVAGSGSANSNVRGMLAAPLDGLDYVADGPASWELGDMVPGEVVTLTYSAIVANDTEPGTYENIAFVEGWACSYQGIELPEWPRPVPPRDDVQFNTLEEIAIPEIDDEHEDEHKNPCPLGMMEYYPNPDGVSAQFHTFGGFATLVSILGNLSDGEGDPFVESAVTVVDEEEPQGFVLGIQIEELANTGVAAVLPTAVGALVAITALGVAVGSSRRSRGIFRRFAGSAKQLVLVLAFVLGMSGTAVAATGAGWQLNVVDLPANTPNDSIDIAYQVASVDSADTFTVSLWQDGVMIDSQAVATAYGDNGSFTVSDLEDGSYEFTVLADNSGDAADKTNSQNITVDTDAPEAVSYEGVEQDGNDFTLTFTVPAGSDGTTVNVYASTSKEFEANAQTLVGSVAATPGSEQTFEYTAENDSQRYFALEIVDEAGNASPLVGDSETVVTGGSGNGSAVITSGVDAGSVAGSDSEDAEVLGEDVAQADDQTAADGETSEDGESDESSSSNRAWIALGVVAVAVAGYVFRQRTAE